jgi:hypothetical protein
MALRDSIPVESSSALLLNTRLYQLTYTGRGSIVHSCSRLSPWLAIILSCRFSENKLPPRNGPKLPSPVNNVKTRHACPQMDGYVTSPCFLNFSLFLMSLRILILGSGGREHALAWKLSQSPLVDHIYVAPGNGGTAVQSKTTNIEGPSDFPSLVQFALEKEVCFHQIDERRQTLLLNLLDWSCHSRARAASS